MTNTTRAAERFTVRTDRGEPSALLLHGRFTAGGARELEAAAHAVLALSPGELVLDLVELDGAGAALLRTVNELAARLPDGARLVLRVAEEDATAFEDGALHAAVMIQATAAIPEPVAKRPASAPASAPTPGTVRREGRGFVNSYGAGRECAASGCTTALSRYNERDVCFTHATPQR